MSVVGMPLKSNAAKAFKEADADSRGNLGDRTHDQICRDRLLAMEKEDGYPPIADGGVLYRFDPQAKIFKAYARDALALDYAGIYPHEKRCKTRKDYLALAEHTVPLADCPDFFACAPVGFAAGGAFFRIAEAGMEREPLGPQHRQRSALPAEPDEGAATPLLNAFLTRAFNGGDSLGQTFRFAEALGGVISRALPKMQKAVLLLGIAASGKSTAARFVEAMVPPSFVTATPPHQWGHEYYLASLSRSSLNLVGETSHNQAIPGAAFKAVLGGDLLQGRNPNHRPIEFRNQAAHVFLANTLPPTDDRGDGFFRRWEIIEFRNQLKPEDMVPEFAERVLREEFPGLLAFAVQGAVRLAQQGFRFTQSETHTKLLLRWRMAASSVIEFLHDDEVCLLSPEVECTQSDLFDGYRAWATRAGRKPIGRKSFADEIDANGAAAGVARRRGHAGARLISGVRLVVGAEW